MKASRTYRRGKKSVRATKRSVSSLTTLSGHASKKMPKIAKAKRTYNRKGKASVRYTKRSVSSSTSRSGHARKR